MTKDVLKNHYERKYIDENDALMNMDTIKNIKLPGNRIEAAINFIPKYFKGGDIIELGAGNGIVAKTLLETELPISTYTVGDISLPRLNGIRNNLKDERLLILELDAENIPEDHYGKYDAVIMIAVIEHLIDPLRAMQNIRRLLKPSGFVYIDTPNIAKYTRRIKLLFGRFPSTASINEGLVTYSGDRVDLFDEGHLHYFTYRALTLMLTQRCGFSHVKKLGYPIANSVLERKILGFLAGINPGLFSELSILAFA
ncbi:MAG: class I SAM-dependent methyltransferase [Bellilinea sp.]